MSKDPKIEEMMEFATHMMKSATERIGKTPFARQLGIRLLDHEKGRVRLIAPYDEKLVGSLEDGFVHGGVVTTLLDNASGLSIATALDEPKSMATLDLRIDYEEDPIAALRALCARAGQPPYSGWLDVVPVLRDKSRAP